MSLRAVRRPARIAAVSTAIAAAIVALVLSILFAPRRPANATDTLKLPNVEPFKLAKGSKLDDGPDKENSGIVKSRQRDDLYWINSDSGNKPRIYPVHRDGKLYKNKQGGPDGVKIDDLKNDDWEDIDVDASGHVIIADIGNNKNDRRDLALYYVDEPDRHAGHTPVVRKVLISYPEQKQFPAPDDDFNYDAEAIFTLGDRVFICTKHRSDTRTTVYRVDAPVNQQSSDGSVDVRATLTRVDDFDVHGKATSADATPDGKHVVVLTYESLWLFDVTDPEHPLSGPVRWLPFKGSNHAEAICFADDQTLLMGDESTARLYEVPIDAFVPVSR